MRKPEDVIARYELIVVSQAVCHNCCLRNSCRLPVLNSELMFNVCFMKSKLLELLGELLRFVQFGALEKFSLQLSIKGMHL